MNDDELIRRMHETPPEELSLADMEHLRRRMPHSERVRQALRDHVRLEETLGAGLGRIDLSVDLLLAKASAASHGASRFLSRLYGWGAASLLLAIVATVALVAVRQRDPQLAQRHARDERPAKADQASPDKQAKRNRPTRPSRRRPPLAHRDSDDGTASPSDDLSEIRQPPPHVDVDSTRDQERKSQPLPENEPGPGNDARFEYSPAAERSATFGSLEDWLVSIQGMPHRPAIAGQHGLAMDGVSRLNKDWAPGETLRADLADHHNLRLHVWHGVQGVTLHYFAFPAPAWAAYAATRPKGDPLPRRLALVGTDNDRFRHCRANQVDLTFRDGLLTLSQGDLVLLTVPMVGAPEEVYWDGHATIHGLRTLSCAPPRSEVESAPDALVDLPPAALDWQTELAVGAHFNALPEGRVELLAEECAAPSVAFVPIVDGGLREVIFEIEDPLPGTGVFLGDGAGRALHRVGFMLDPKTGQICLDHLAPDEARTEAIVDATQAPVPFVGQTVWLRLVCSGGTLQTWLSADGSHWGRGLAPKVDGSAGFAVAGVYCLPGAATRCLRVRRVEARVFAGLTSVARADLLDSALVLADVADPGAWIEAVVRNVPSNVSARDWQRACATKTLARGPNPALAQSLLWSLVDAGLQSNLPPTVQFRLLDEAALISCSAPSSVAESETVRRLEQAYQQLAWRLCQRGESQVFSTVRRALARSPCCANPTWQVLPDWCLRGEIQELFASQDWLALARGSRELAFWLALGRDSAPPNAARTEQELLVTRAARLAEIGLQPSLSLGENASQKELAHPLLEQVKREEVNLLGELDEALQLGAYRDACQVISSVGILPELGLLPDARDPRLLVSLDGVVTRAMEQYPPLRESMRAQFGQVARLRIGRAMEDEDVAAVESAASQFQMTDAAVEAHRWLGDRALGAGEFPRARAEYRQAWRQADADARQQLAPRLRLASAMLGQDDGARVTQPVELATGQYSAEEFEQLVAEMLARFTAEAGTQPAALEPPASVPPATTDSNWTSHPWSRLAASGHAAANAPRDTWGERIQVATTQNVWLATDGQTTWALNRFDGMLLWTHPHPHDATNLPLASSVPGILVLGSTVVIHLPNGSRMELQALDLATGQPVWKSPRDVHVACLPWRQGNQLAAFTVASPFDREWDLRLTSFDPATGQESASPVVASFHPTAGLPPRAQAITAADEVVCMLAGCTLCVDVSGRVRWLRKQPWLPASLLSNGPWSGRAALLACDDLVICAQPMANAVECLSAESGRLVWRRFLPDLRACLGRTENLLLLRDDSGCLALQLSDGQFAWRRPLTGMLAATLHETDALCIARQQPLVGGQARPILTWLDPTTGRDLAWLPLREFVGSQPACGPIVAQGDQWWALAASSADESAREILELRPGQESISSQESGLDLTWPMSADATLQDACRVVLAGWTLLDGESDETTGLYPEFRAASDVFMTKATPQRATRLVRQVVLPKANAKLRIQVAQPVHAQWQLGVQVNGQPVTSQLIQPATSSDGWQTILVDLGEVSGQQVWLTIDQQSAGGASSYVAWKQAALVSEP